MFIYYCLNPIALISGNTVVVTGNVANNHVAVSYINKTASIVSGSTNTDGNTASSVSLATSISIPAQGITYFASDITTGVTVTPDATFTTLVNNNGGTGQYFISGGSGIVTNTITYASSTIYATAIGSFQ